MMKKIALFLGALGLAGAAMVAGGETASAATAGATISQAQAVVKSNAVQVRQWHQSGPSRFHKRWRSHHRHGSRHY